MVNLRTNLDFLKFSSFFARLKGCVLPAMAGQKCPHLQSLEFEVRLGRPFMVALRAWGEFRLHVRCSPAPLVTSLNRPGGNVTGVSFFTNQMEAKRLGLLHEVAPKVELIAALLNG